MLAVVLVSVLAGVVVPTAVEAHPASAAGSLVPPGGPGSGGSTGSGGGSDTGGAAYCAPVGWLPFGGIGLVSPYNYPLWAHQPAYGVFPPCSRSGTWIDDYLDCQTAYEVWRFYGTEANPVQAWTFSRAWMPDSCNVTLGLAMVAPHPDDEFSFSPTGAPFRYEYVFGPETTAFSSTSGKGWSGTVLGIGAWYATTSRPDRSGGSCTSLSANEDLIGRYFLRPGPYGPYKGSEYDSTGAPVLRKALRQVYDRFAGTWSPEWARVAINATSVGTDPAGGDIVYGDGRPCSSDLDFYSALADGQTTPTADQQKLIGGCWLPVRRNEQGWYLYSGDYLFTDNWWYPEYYKASHWSDPAAFGRVIQTYAYASALEAASRPVEVNPDPTPLIPKYGGPLSVPLWGAESVYYGADCGLVKGAVGSASSSTSTTPPFPASVDVNVTVPEVGQVGGKLSVSKISTRAVPPPATADGPFIDSLSLNVSVTAPSGYPITEWWKSRFSSSGNRGSMDLWFLRPTDPGTKFTVSVTGTARLRAIQHTTTNLQLPCSIVNGSSLGFQTGNPLSGGSLCDLGTTSTTETIYKTVPIRAVYSPASTFPVIAATEIPRPSR